MFYPLIGFLALILICSTLTALGLLALRAIEGRWELSWDVFAAGIGVAFCLAAVYGVSYGLGYAIVRHVWR